MANAQFFKKLNLKVAENRDNSVDGFQKLKIVVIDALMGMLTLFINKHNLEAVHLCN